MPHIELEGQIYEFSDLKHTNHGKHPALTFCHHWLNGQRTFLLQTSGSTGAPKPIAIDRQQMEASAEGTAVALGLDSTDKALICLNTSYIGGMMMLVRAMVLEMDVLLLPPAGNPISKVPPHFKPTFVGLVPMQLAYALSSVEGRALLQQMKAIIVGGASVSTMLENRLQIIEAPIYSTYGMTETVSHFAIRRLNGPARSDLYRILQDVEVAQDDRGCLKVRGSVTLGKWLQTNDLVEMAPDGLAFRWLGRIDDIINTGGVKVPIAVVEAAIEQWMADHGHAGRVAVVGMPDPMLGQCVTAVWEGQASPAWAEAMLQDLHHYLQMYQVPKCIFAVDKFPETATAKVDRQALAASLAANT